MASVFAPDEKVRLTLHRPVGISVYVMFAGEPVVKKVEGTPPASQAICSVKREAEIAPFQTANCEMDEVSFLAKNDRA